LTGFRPLREQIADQRRQDARKFVPPKRDGSAQAHRYQTEPRHALGGIHGFSRARCQSLKDSASYVLRERNPGEINRSEFSSFKYKSPQQMSGGERGGPVAVAAGDLAHHANAARHEEKNIENSSRADGSYTERTGAGPAYNRLGAPVERRHNGFREQLDLLRR